MSFLNTWVAIFIPVCYINSYKECNLVFLLNNSVLVLRYHGRFSGSPRFSFLKGNEFSSLASSLQKCIGNLFSTNQEHKCRKSFFKKVQFLVRIKNASIVSVKSCLLFRYILSFVDLRTSDIYISKDDGKDVPSCGSLKVPCKTLQHAVYNISKR